MIHIQFDEQWEEGFLERIETDGPWTSFAQYEIAYEVEKATQVPAFHGLQVIRHVPDLHIYPHQLEVAQTVIEDMNGKAILADEVGLGKTIEAGLILKEYMIRGLVKKALILVPASLISQWVDELNSKFHIPAVAQRKSYVWEQCDIVVASLDKAKKEPHCDVIMEQQYDLIIIDEAHKLKNNKTKNYEFVRRLKKKFFLLLTATPIQNKLEDIFNLVSLLKPGHLGSIQSFGTTYKTKHREAKNEAVLNELIHKVMVRNRRVDTNIKWPERIVATVPITFSDQERLLYDELDTLTSLQPFTLLTLKRELCSSREALYMTLKKLIERNEIKKDKAQILLTKINNVMNHAKAEKALQLIKKINDKVIIFTEYRATQLYLQWFLQKHGISSVPFRGGFKHSKKDWMRQRFANDAQVLIATEAGGEGINLQFCHHLINYDLPWNPMKVEQRIGRIHRLGQKKDVHIYNFAVVQTVEQQILQLLYDKIQLFESVIGELDEIISKVERSTYEKYIEDMFTQSDSIKEMRLKFDHLTALIETMNDDKE